MTGKSGKELREVIVEIYSKLFKSLESMIPELHIKLNDNTSPIVLPSWKIPIGLLEKLKKELDNMEKTGVIRKVDEPTELVSLMLVVEKANGELRICLDPKDLNEEIKREYYELPTFKEICKQISGVKVFIKIDANKGY